MASHDTLFTVDPGAAGGAVQFVADAFGDISLAPSNNSGLTSSASTNPLSSNFNDDDAPKFGVKTLFFKDLVLIDDRSQWVSNKPTYQVIWNENYPGVTAYAFGDMSIHRLVDNRLLQFRTIGDGIGVSGVFRKVVWLVSGSGSATATGQLSVDGAATTTVDFSGAPFETVIGDAFGPTGAPTDGGNFAQGVRYWGVDGSPSLQTKNIHDYRLTALQAGTLKIIGVAVYYENTGANIDLFPGTTYVNKNRSFTSTGATTALPALGSSLGGRNLIYKTQNNSYGVTSSIAAMIQSIAQGSSGTNLCSVSTGHGASFPVGSGIVIKTAGSSSYVGTVQVQSTDTLTVSPTLPFGISGLVYKYFGSNATLAINASMYSQAMVIGPSQWIAGITTCVLDPLGRFGMFGGGITTTIGASIYPMLTFAPGTSGFMQVDGFFSAAEIEFVGSGICHATLSVNGNPVWSINQGQTGTVKRTVFSDAGPGWNSFVFNIGTSMGSSIGISKVDLYQMRQPIGVSFGALAYFDTEQSFTERTNGYNATIMFLGAYRRYYGDQLGFQGNWTRLAGSTFAAGHAYAGASTNSTVTVNFYGKNFCVIGTQGTSVSITLDGVATGASFNTLLSAASEGFHNLIVSHKAGTSVVTAVDVHRTNAEVSNVQSYNAIPSVTKLTNRRVPIITEWQQYYPVIKGQTSDPIRATNAVETAIWRRIGDSIEVMYYYTCGNGVGATGGAGNYSFSLPEGFNFDFKKLRQITQDSGAAGIVVGNGLFADASVSNNGVADGTVITNNGNLTTNTRDHFVQVYLNKASTGGSLLLWGTGNGSYCNFGSTNVVISFKFGGPIYGWKVDE